MGRVYQVCIRGVMLYGSETWAVKDDNEYMIFVLMFAINFNFKFLYPCSCFQPHREGVEL